MLCLLWPVFGTSWRNVKFDVCLDVWREPNFGLTFDGDVWRSTLRISNVVEQKHQTLFSLHSIRGFYHCYRIIAGIQQINSQFLSCFRLKFFKFFKLTREVLNFVKKFWRWENSTLRWRFFFYVDVDVLHERQTSWNLIDVPNTGYGHKEFERTSMELGKKT